MASETEVTQAPQLTQNYQLRFFDKTIQRLKIDVSDRPNDWDPVASQIKRSVLSIMTSHYVKFDIAKSAMQKAVRRGFADEAVYWALTMFGTPPQGITNMWNRLLIMSVEDIGPANLGVVSMVYHLYQTGKNNPLNVAQAAYLLAASKKSRFFDLCYHYYNGIPANKSNNTMVDEIIASINEPYSFDKLFATIHMIVQLKVRHIEAREQAQVEKKARIEQLQELGRETKGIKAKSTISYLKRVVDGIAKLNNGNAQGYVVQMVALRKNLTDGYVLGVIQLVLCLQKKYDNNIVFTVCDLTIDPRVEWLTKEVYAGKVLFDVPDYAFDKHTSVGKLKMKRGTKHFYEEGTVLNNRGGEWIEMEDRLYDTIVSKLE